MEQHHRKLSELLKAPLGHGSRQLVGGHEAAEHREERSAGTSGPPSPEELAKPDPAATGVAAATPKPVPTLPHQPRYPARELSSSIASNLATARGIKSKYRGQPLIPSVTIDQAPGSLEVHPRGDNPANVRSKAKPNSRADKSPRKPSWVPPAHPAGQRAEAEQSASVSKADGAAVLQSDEGFSRFYNTFGSIINRLSAPLAFAGLPLIAEESTTAEPAAAAPVPEQPPPQRKRRPRTPQPPGAEPDLSKIYSKAALRALRGEGNNPNDSFYVVPTSGHTVSYANILTFDQKEKRRMAASSHRDDAHAAFEGAGADDDDDEDDDDDFVDAAESQMPISPGLKRRVGKSQLGARDMQNAVEELYLENTSLKEMLDKVSKRLHAFEVNSQSSHLALAQSLRLQRPGSPMSSSGGGGGQAPATDGGGGRPESSSAAAEEALRKRNRELEEQVAATAKKMEALEKEYGKVQLTVEKYRDRWEKLKAGAKARREAQGSVDNGRDS